MGAGIAAVFAARGSDVQLVGRRQQTLDAAAERIATVAGDAARRVELTTDLEQALAGAELLVESIVEDVDAKRRVFELAERMAPDAILTSNTSSLRISELAAELRRPERFAGLHWLNPPELVELVEIIGTDTTEPELLDVLARWMLALGKTPVLVKRDVPGFLVNRLQYALLREAWALVDDGVCTFEDVDRVLTRGLGPRWAAVGPYEAMDFGGLDVFLAVGTNLLPQLSNATQPPEFLSDAVEEGALGAKSGRGLLRNYTPEEIAEIAARRERIARGIQRLRNGKERE
jgi:3-hydroxybutyryl-CoA dehydrogenase